MCKPDPIALLASFDDLGIARRDVGIEEDRGANAASVKDFESNETLIPVSSASIFAGRLKSGTAFRSVYRFDIPTAASDLWVRYDDPGRTTPIWIDLGNRPIPVGISSAYNIHLHYFTPHHYGGGR